MGPCHYFVWQQGRKKSLKKDGGFLADRLPITVVHLTLFFWKESYPSFSLLKK